MLLLTVCPNFPQIMYRNFLTIIQFDSRPVIPKQKMLPVYFLSGGWYVRPRQCCLIGLCGRFQKNTLIKFKDVQPPKHE